jgi:phospholipase C
MKMITAGLITLSVAGACSPNDSGSTNIACKTILPVLATPPSGWNGSVFTIVMENHSQGDIFGNADAPYINRLAKQYAVAYGYHDSFVHPSEANYLWMASGENFGVLDDNDPDSHHLDSTSHLVDQIEMAGLDWKSYQESMGDPCGLTSHGRYAAKHDPFVFFNDVNGWDGTKFHPELRCNQHVVDYSQLDVDLASGNIPDYVFITPNLDDDMHDGSVKQGDTWLANEIPKILASERFQAGGVLFLMWDEGSGYPVNDDPPMIVISPNAKMGMASHEDYDESSYVKTVQSVLGVEQLPCNGSADSQRMDGLFAMSMDSQPVATAQ